MANAQFLSAMLKPIGDRMLSIEERRNEQKLQAKRDQIAMITAAMPHMDDPNAGMRMLYDLTGGGKGKGGRPNPGMQMLEKIVMQSGNAPEQSPRQSPMAGVSMQGGEAPARSIMQGVSMDGGAAPAESPFQRLDMQREQIPTVVREQVPTSLGELPRLRTRAETEAAELERFAAQQRIITEETRGRNAGKLVPGASVTVSGSDVPPDVEVDADGQPINRRDGRYKMLPYQDGTKQYVRIEGRQLTGTAAKVDVLAKQLQAVARSQGQELSDEQAQEMAWVEMRVNDVADRQQRMARLDQMMAATDLQMQRGTQLYNQSAQMFPLLVAAREAGLELSELRQELIRGNPRQQLLAAFNTARQMVSDIRSEHFRKPIGEVHDQLTRELYGKPLAELRAEAEAMERDGGDDDAPAPRPAATPRVDDPKQDAGLRAKAKAALEADNKPTTAADIDALLSDEAWVKYLRSGGE